MPNATLTITSPRNHVIVVHLTNIPLGFINGSTGHIYFRPSIN